MWIRSPARTYTPQALKFWGHFLLDKWEKSFSTEALKQGRFFYKNHSIKSLDIQEGCLGVQLRDENRQSLLTYAIFEKNTHGEWAMRASVDDAILGNALIVAGLYELEEFLAEADDSIWDESVPVVKPTHHSKSSNKLSVDKSLPYKNECVVEVVEANKRSMQLFFEVRGKNFYFYILLGEDKKRFSLGDPLKQSKEREDAIRLLHWSKKAGFLYQSQDKTYLFQHTLEAAQEFLKQSLPLWQRYYVIHLSDSVRLLLKGLQLVKCINLVEKVGNGVRLKPSLDLGGHFLKGAIFKQLLKMGGEGVVEGYGWLSLSEKIKATAKQELSWVFTDHIWPSYMIYGVFNHLFDDCRMTPEVLALKQSLEMGVLKSNNALMPSFLRHYQVDGVQWMQQVLNAGGHPLLADEMGLGKTLQILTLLSTHWKKGLALVVCPASVVSVWQQEVERFFPAWVVAILSKSNPFKASESPILWIASYTQLRRNRGLLSDVFFEYVVVDEAQVIKNPQAKTAQAVYAIQSQYRIALTGTPIENRHLDIWSVFRFLMPGLLGTKAFFERQVKQSSGLDLLKSQIKVFVLRRLKSSVLKELPEKTQMVLPCELTPMQRELYQAYSGQLLKDCPDGFIHPQNVSLLTGLMRLRQIVCDPGLLPDQEALDFEASGKLKVLYERLVELIDNGEKVVVFSQFVRFLKRVAAYLLEDPTVLDQTPLFFLTGQTKNRASVIESFQNHEGPAIVLASLKAAGAGITLHAASYVFLLDPWWNPAVEAQAIDRVHRLGQKKPVFIYRLVAQGTLEDKIEALKHYKQGIFNDVLEDLPDLTRLEAHFQSLKHLISLQ